jgi:hypothetical protein
LSMAPGQSACVGISFPHVIQIRAQGRRQLRQHSPQNEPENPVLCSRRLTEPPVCRVESPPVAAHDLHSWQFPSSYGSPMCRLHFSSFPGSHSSGFWRVGAREHSVKNREKKGSRTRNGGLVLAVLIFARRPATRDSRLASSGWLGVAGCLCPSGQDVKSRPRSDGAARSPPTHPPQPAPPHPAAPLPTPPFEEDSALNGRPLKAGILIPPNPSQSLPIPPAGSSSALLPPASSLNGGPDFRTERSS